MHFFDDLFIATNIRIYHHMDESEFEGLFYDKLSENTFKNQGINTKIIEGDWTISDYLSHHFRFKIGETMTCISCHQNKEPNIL